MHFAVKMPKDSKMYHSVSLDDEEGQPLNAGGENQAMRFTSPREARLRNTINRVSHSQWVWIVHAVLLSMSAGLFAFSYCLSQGMIFRPSDLTLTRQISSWSPAEEAAKYETVRYNLTPIMNTEFTGYGPEVDKAWERISDDVGDQMMSAEEVEKMGLPLDSIKIKHPKTGVEGYRIGMEVFHQLHCLNLVRQAVYKDWYDSRGGDIGVEEDDLKGHLDHCIETLRMNLMCQSDIGVFTFKRYPELGDDDPWPIFSTLHVCRNYEGIRKWAMEKSVAFGNEH
ncbi:uncharacterized protein MKZ38_006086 [Zalerion maritima]|uniref:Cyclochlorotine biosynthesis protein O n=1 Tax=Zalerion maritima TaxID=339359 RepID=A0AAD5RXB1_9PEZI|nr:uncharacterized protein MKZ38_006086 [Zalerion maritima]